MYGKHYEKNQEYFDMLIKYFKENQITDVIKDKIKNYCEREIATVRCLTPVVATLDDQILNHGLELYFIWMLLLLMNTQWRDAWLILLII